MVKIPGHVSGGGLSCEQFLLRLSLRALWNYSRVGRSGAGCEKFLCAWPAGAQECSRVASFGGGLRAFLAALLPAGAQNLLAGRLVQERLASDSCCAWAGAQDSSRVASFRGGLQAILVRLIPAGAQELLAGGLVQGRLAGNSRAPGPTGAQACSRVASSRGGLRAFLAALVPSHPSGGRVLRFLVCGRGVKIRVFISKLASGVAGGV